MGHAAGGCNQIGCFNVGTDNVGTRNVGQGNRGDNLVGERSIAGRTRREEDILLGSHPEIVCTVPHSRGGNMHACRSALQCSGCRHKSCWQRPDGAEPWPACKCGIGRPRHQEGCGCCSLHAVHWRGIPRCCCRGTRCILAARSQRSPVTVCPSHTRHFSSRAAPQELMPSHTTSSSMMSQSQTRMLCETQPSLSVPVALM